MASYNKEKILLLLAYLGNLSAPIGTSAFVALIPAFERLFNIDVRILALAVTLYMVMFGILQLFSGSLSDIFGRKKFIIMGLSFYSLGSFLLVLFPSVFTLLLGRVIQGIGDGLMNPVYLAVIGDISTDENRSKYVSILAALIMFGNALGAYLGGFFGEVLWWVVYLSIGLLSLILIVMYFIFMNEKTTYSSRNKKSAIVFHFNSMKQLFKHKGVQALILGSFLFFSIRGSLLTFLADTLGNPPISYTDYQIGILYAYTNIITLAFGLISGVIISKISEKYTIVLGSLLLSMPFALFLYPSWLSFVYVILFIYSAGNILLYAVLNTLAVEIVPELKGSVSSLFNSFLFLGFAAGPVLFLDIYLQLGFFGISIVCLIIAIINTYILVRIPKFR
ncbi:MAG: MFS transporter [Candidatus Asgardarchaeia archaeon]